MPAGNTSLHGRALRRALTHESIALSWGAVAFVAAKNPLPVTDVATAGNVDRNDGDNTSCTLLAVAADFPGALPEQGDRFTDAEGRSYRVARVEYTPGLPAIVFHIPNIVTPT